MRRLSSSARVLLPLLACIALAACADDARDADDLAMTEEASIGMATGSGGADPVAPAPPPAPEYRSIQGVERAKVADMAQANQALPPQTTTPGARNRDASMIIRTGEARVEVDSLEAGIEAVQITATALGGWIAQSFLNLGDRQQRSARLEVKVPAERWGELVGGLERIGELRQLSTSTEDVGEQFVDLQAQLSNGERLEERYLQLLQTRTGSLEDLLAVERELARVRERIEMLQGRLRYLDQRVAISTIFINLEEPLNLLALPPESDPLRDAFRAAWRNFLGVITGGIALLGGALPVALLLAALVWVWRRARRRS